MKHQSKELITRAAAFFKVVGDETRMKILCAISTDELCVNDIASALDMTKSAVSHQLRLLKDEGLVKSRRDGKTIFYSIADEHVKTIFYHAMDHVME